MKKLFWLFLMLAAITLMPMAALGAGEGGGAFFTWQGIGTYGGAVALVVFMVQALKLPLDRVWKIPTRIVVYFVSLGVLLLAQCFVPALGGLTWENGLLCVFNAFLVALAAMSTYEVAIDKVEMGKLEQLSATLESVHYDDEKGDNTEEMV